MFLLTGLTFLDIRVSQALTGFLFAEQQEPSPRVKT
jgi:hypothetical protein